MYLTHKRYSHVNFLKMYLYGRHFETGDFIVRTFPPFTYTKVRYTCMQNLFEEILNYELSMSNLIQMGRQKTMHTFIEIL